MSVKPETLPDDPEFWRSRYSLLLALAAVFAIKSIVLLELKDHPLLAPDAGLDTTAYVQLAQRVLAGDWGLGPSLYYVSPFYIYFLAAALGLLKSFTAVRVVQIALGTAATGGIFLMTREWFGERAAWWAMALAALTGLFTFFEILILQSSMDVVLTTAALCALTLALTRDRHALFLLSGVVFGLMTLNRPNVLLAAGAIVVTLALLRRVRFAALLLAGVLAGMAPAAIRNAVVSREFTFVSSHGGLNFYIGNGDGATGFYRPVPGITPTIGGQETDTIRVASQAIGRPVDASEASSYFFDLGLSWMRQHSIDAAGLFVRKLYYVFNAAFVGLGQSYPFYVHDERTILRFLFVGPWLLVPLGLVGLIFGVRRVDVAQASRRGGARTKSPRKDAGPETSGLRRAYLVWIVFVPAYAIAVAIFFVAERYRLPLLVPLVVGAGAAIDLFVETIREHRGSSLALPAAAVVALAIAANWPLGLSDGRWEEGLRLAQRLVILGRDAEAAAVASRIAPREPQAGATDYGVGAQLLQIGRADLALPYLERAHAANPADARTDYAFGQALLARGRAREALPHLRHGFDAGIALPQGGYDYALALRDGGDLAGAVAAIKGVNPGDDPEAWLRAGRFAVEAHAPDVAEAFFRRAAAMRPDAASHQQLGVDLLLLEKYDDAARELTEANRLDPRDAGTLSHLAYAEAKLDRLDAARTHTMQALAIDPNDPLARQLAAALR